MFKSILVPLCREECGPEVPRHAIALARREGARIVAIHVVDHEELSLPAGVDGMTPAEWRATVESELRTEGQELLDRLAAACAAEGIEVETLLSVGPVVETVCCRAQTADLILMGQGGDYVRRGGVLAPCPMEGVIRRACRPVLVATGAPRPVESILVAYDGGAGARSALAMAAGLASEWRASLLLVAVAERGVGRDTLAAGQAQLGSFAPQVKTILREGKPATEILQVAAGERADLIAMGAYCHGPIQELVLGGTVGQVARKSTCPVLICPP